MIAFQDFAPRILSPPTWGQGQGEWEAIEDVIANANEWIQKEKIDIINIETVVMPCHVGTPAYDQTASSASWINPGHWHVNRQFIRVWYRLHQMMK